MLKKILLSAIILGTIGGTTVLGACPESAPQQSQGCNNFKYKKRFCNDETAFTIRTQNNPNSNTNFTFQEQKNLLNIHKKQLQIENNIDFKDYHFICELQRIIQVNEDGMLGKETINQFLQYDLCSKLGLENNNGVCSHKEEEEVCTYEGNKECFCNTYQTDERCKTPTPTPQQTPKCGEHAYTCASGENPSDQKYNEKEKTCTRKCGETSCPEDGKAVKCSTYSEAEQQLGIGLNKDCLVHGGCSLDVYKTLGIRQNSKKETRTSVLSFFQDVIGASTFFIGTILTIAFVISGFRYVLAGASGNDPQNAKNGMKYSIIGFVLVMSAYAIIRFVQYLASTGG